MEIIITKDDNDDENGDDNINYQDDNGDIHNPEDFYAVPPAATATSNNVNYRLLAIGSISLGGVGWLANPVRQYNSSEIEVVQGNL